MCEVQFFKFLLVFPNVLMYISTTIIIKGYFTNKNRV